VRVLRARVERVTVVGRVVVADGAAGLERVRGQPIVDEPQRHDVPSPGEGRVRGVLLAEHQREGDVARPVFPDLRRAVLHRILDGHRRRQGLVVDLDQLGGFPRLLGRLGDDEGDALPDVANLVRGQQRPERAIALRPAHVLGHGARRNPAEPLPDGVGASEHATHTGDLERPGDVHASDPRVRVRRQAQSPVRLAGKIDVVHVPGPSDEEATILDTTHGLANAKGIHVIRPPVT
jgi:hypothetical protein